MLPKRPSDNKFIPSTRLLSLIDSHNPRRIAEFLTQLEQKFGEHPDFKAILEEHVPTLPNEAAGFWRNFIRETNFSYLSEKDVVALLVLNWAWNHEMRFRHPWSQSLHNVSAFFLPRHTAVTKRLPTLTALTVQDPLTKEMWRDISRCHGLTTLAFRCSDFIPVDCSALSSLRNLTINTHGVPHDRYAALTLALSSLLNLETLELKNIGSWPPEGIIDSMEWLASIFTLPALQKLTLSHDSPFVGELWCESDLPPMDLPLRELHLKNLCVRQEGRKGFEVLAQLSGLEVLTVSVPQYILQESLNSLSRLQKLRHLALDLEFEVSHDVKPQPDLSFLEQLPVLRSLALDWDGPIHIENMKMLAMLQVPTVAKLRLYFPSGINIQTLREIIILDNQLTYDQWNWLTAECERTNIQVTFQSQQRQRGVILTVGSLQELVDALPRINHAKHKATVSHVKLLMDLHESQIEDLNALKKQWPEIKIIARHEIAAEAEEKEENRAARISKRLGM